MARLLKISHFTLVVGSEKRLQDGHIVGRPAHDVQHLGHPLPLHSHAFRSRVHGLAAQHTVHKLDIPNFFPEIKSSQEIWMTIKLNLYLISSSFRPSFTTVQESEITRIMSTTLNDKAIDNHLISSICQLKAELSTIARDLAKATTSQGSTACNFG